MPVRLHLTHVPELDTLVALEYGRVDEGVPAVPPVTARSSPGNSRRFRPTWLRRFVLQIG
jgi:hypothetical protein